MEHTYYCLWAALFTLARVKRKIARFSFTFYVTKFFPYFLFISAVKNVQVCNFFVRTGKTLVYFKTSTPCPIKSENRLSLVLSNFHAALN